MPELHDQLEAGVIEVVDPIEGAIEVVAIVLMDGPLAPVSLGIGQGDAEEYKVPRSSAGPMPGFETADKRQDKVKNVTQKVQNAAQGITDKTKDVATTVADKA